MRVKPPSRHMVADARKVAGHTQAEAAATVFRTLNTWQKWEAGQVPMPRGLYEYYLQQTGQFDDLT